jgi:hypothetical protein
VLDSHIQPQNLLAIIFYHRGQQIRYGQTRHVSGKRSNPDRITKLLKNKSDAPNGALVSARE